MANIGHFALKNYSKNNEYIKFLYYSNSKNIYIQSKHYVINQVYIPDGA